jgi:hypothetical protein
MPEDVVQVIFRARDELSRAVGEMSQTVGGFVSQLSRAIGPATVFATAIAAVGSTAAAVTKHVANLGDELAKASTRTGIAAEDLSAFKLALELSDSSLDAFVQGFRFLSTNLSNAIQKSGEARDALQALGFSLADLRRAQADPIAFLEEFARRLFEIRDGTQRADAAVAVLGRSAVGLLPFLRDLSERGLRGMREEAARLGVLMSDDLARAAEAFNDNLTRLKAAAQGLAIVIGGPLIQALNDLAVRFGLVQETPLQGVVRGIDETLSRLRKQEAQLQRELQFWPEGVTAFVTRLDLAEVQKQIAQLEESREALVRAGREPATGTRTFELPDRAAAEAAERAERAKQAIDAVTKSLSEQATALVGQVIKLRDGEQAALRYQLTMQLAAAEAELFANKIQITPEVRAQWNALVERILDLNQQLTDTAQHLERLKDFDAEKLRQAFAELEGLRRLEQISREVSDAFLSDRQRDLLAAQRWGEGLRQQLAELVADAPMLADRVSDLMARIPAAVEEMELRRQAGEIQDVFRGMGDAITTSLNGVIQGTQSLSDAISHLARNLLLGLGNRLITAGIDAITAALARMAAEALRASGGTGGGIIGLIGGLLGRVVGGLAGGGGGAAGVDLPLAKGGIVPGGFLPLPALGIRLARQLSGQLAGLPFQAFRAGGIARQPTFGLVGEGQFAEAVVPLPDNRHIPVRFEGPPPRGAERPAPQVHVQILGHIIPQVPTMTKADVVRVVVEDIAQDGPTRRAIQQQGRR